MEKANLKILLGTILVIVGGLVLPAGILIPAFNTPNEQVVFETPGQASLQIKSPGRFYLWHHYRTLHEGRKVVREEQPPDGMTFEVTRTDGGSDLSFHSRSNIEFEMGDEASVSIGYVDVERPGTLRIEVRGGDDRMRVMSFSRSRLMLFTHAVGFSLVSLAILGSAGIMLIIFGIAQRAGKTRA